VSFSLALSTVQRRDKMVSHGKAVPSSILTDSPDSGSVPLPLEPNQIRHQMLFDQHCTSPPRREKRYRDTIVLLLSWVASDLNIDEEVLFSKIFEVKIH
jgi:hypothetical protein